MYFLIFIALMSIIHAWPYDDRSLSVKIVGGRLAKIEDYPFQVALLMENTLWCGGTIVSNRYVLTAAHCTLFATSPLYVRSGSSYWNKGGSLHHVTYNISFGRKENEDVSVLLVDEPFLFDETRQPIPIFTRSDVIFPGTLGTAIGWGSTGENFISEHLRSVELPYVDPQACQDVYSGTVIGNITKGEICAGYVKLGGKDACQGDSGGPLVIDGRQAGIVSLGVGCAQPNFPGIYTDVGYYNEWILEQITD